MTVDFPARFMNFPITPNLYWPQRAYANYNTNIRANAAFWTQGDATAQSMNESLSEKPKLG
jgi:hypothetical protein